LTEKKIIIAVDGYSSCGKSTFAKLIAKELEYVYVDTGAMYRAIALYSIIHGFNKNNSLDKSSLLSGLDKINIKFYYNHKTGVSETFLNGENVEAEIRKEHVSHLVSRISSIKEVRQKLVELQQQIGKNKCVVMDGRDIGTVVFPNAEMKIFMKADPLVRAKRRYDELMEKGENVDLKEIEKNIIERDRLDMTRKESPLIQAPDALVLDNSYMTPDEQMEWFKIKFDKIKS